MPFDMEEHESDEFANKCLFRDGTEDNFKAIKTKCKSTGDVKVFKTDESGHAICGPFTEGQDLEWECPAPEGFSDAKGEILVKSGIASKKMVIALNPKVSTYVVFK